jgi:hypothetical protein
MATAKELNSAGAGSRMPRNQLVGNSRPQLELADYYELLTG